MKAERAKHEPPTITKMKKLKIALCATCKINLLT